MELFGDLHAIDVYALWAKWNCIGIFMLLMFMPYGQYLYLYDFAINIDALRAKWNCIGIFMLLMLMPYGQYCMLFCP
jgi:hypothetical protein